MLPESCYHHRLVDGIPQIASLTTRSHLHNINFESLSRSCDFVVAHRYLVIAGKAERRAQKDLEASQISHKKDN